MLPVGCLCSPRYPTKIRPGMICVLADQVKVKNVLNCCKSVGKSTENQRIPRPVKITLRRPDDWHLHVRDGTTLQAVLPHTARCFGRAIIMPNLKTPVTSTAAALAYRERILAAVPGDISFQPLMTIYLTDNTPAHRSTAYPEFIPSANFLPGNFWGRAIQARRG